MNILKMSKKLRQHFRMCPEFNETNSDRCKLSKWENISQTPPVFSRRAWVRAAFLMLRSLSAVRFRHFTLSLSALSNDDAFELGPVAQRNGSSSYLSRRRWWCCVARLPSNVARSCVPGLDAILDNVSRTAAFEPSCWWSDLTTLFWKQRNWLKISHFIKNRFEDSRIEECNFHFRRANLRQLTESKLINLSDITVIT